MNPNQPGRLTLVLATVIFLFIPVENQAQSPDAAWQTIETANFRIHYPAETADWARHVANRIETARRRVDELVGFDPGGTIDVLVVDPFNQPNGAALPFLGRARMILFTTPPAADSVIGHYRDWGELLLLHEQAHLSHLLRPARRWPSPGLRQLWFPFAIGPLSDLPMWATEGYATHLEGRLTGRGRPNSNLRQAIIRQWALEGRLPDYGSLVSPGDGWQDRNLVYLVGSAYYDWLRERHRGDDPFPAVWARATARQSRSFNEAFEGVFGDSPADLYQRYVAETTYAALEAEKQLADNRVEGRLWQPFEGNTGLPAVSPDGSRVAVVIRPAEQASVLKVFSVDDNAERYEEWRNRQDKLVREDPQDVPAVRPQALPREPEASLPAFGGRGPDDPRWIDNDSLLFTRLTRMPDGFLARDLYRWRPASDDVERITHGARLHRADPAPGGDWAVAVRYRHGRSQLVRVDLAGGRITPITEARIDVVHDHPRVHPDGDVIAYLRNGDSGWQLVRREMNGGRERILMSAADGGYLAHPAWSADGETLYAARGDEDRINLVAIDPASGAFAPLTRSVHTAMAPAPVPGQDALLFLSHRADGITVRRIEPAALSEPVVADEPVPVSMSSSDRDPSNAISSRSYGIGPQSASLLLGMRTDPSDAVFDLGVKGGDPVGRLDWQVLGSVSDHGSRDGALASVNWRGWPVAMRGVVFAHDEDPGAQDGLPTGFVSAVPANERTGGLISFAAERYGDNWHAQGELGMVGTEVSGDFQGSRRWQYLDTSADWLLQRGDRYLGLQLGADLREGRTEPDGAAAVDWNRQGFRLDARIGGRKGGMQAFWSHVDMEGAGGGLTLGGQTGAAYDSRTLPFRIAEPALPVGFLGGREYEGQGLSLSGDSGVRLFHRRHRLGLTAPDEAEWTRITGLAVDVSLGSLQLPLPEVRGMGLSAGLARVLDDPLPDHVRYWINLRYAW